MRERRQREAGMLRRLPLAGVGCCVLMVAAVLLSEGGARARSELVAAAQLAEQGAEPHDALAARGEKVLLDGVDKVAQTKRLLELRGRALAQRIRSLSRAVKDEEQTLKRHGVHVKLSQLQDMKGDVDDIQAAYRRVSGMAELPGLKDQDSGANLPAAVQQKQKVMLDKAVALADLAIKDDTMAAAQRSAKATEEKAYKQALIRAAQDHSKVEQEKVKIAERKAEAVLLQKEKALLKARERREALERLAEAKKEAQEKKDIEIQKKIDATITNAVKAAKRDLARKLAPKVPSRSIVMGWAAAAKAAKKGDTRAVHKFCKTQRDSKDCFKALARHAASKKPCNPEMPGYFQCIGVQDTGGTLD